MSLPADVAAVVADKPHEENFDIRSGGFSELSLCLSSFRLTSFPSHVNGTACCGERCLLSLFFSGERKFNRNQHGADDV